MRILGIDYGDSRVGVAVSDPLGMTAQGVGTIKNKGTERLSAELSAIIEKYKPEKIVLGLPKNMDGTEGFRAEVTYSFRDELAKIFDGEIILWDERLSTVSASGILNVTNTRGKDRKKVLDTVAACIILENYLNFRK
ncbi:MAG: Holliday junction resolvase RuvX [Clostridia bacterium]|nr:Holliday junction resolvase RuvX [Clostridia bacterium]